MLVLFWLVKSIPNQPWGPSGCGDLSKNPQMQEDLIRFFYRSIVTSSPAKKTASLENCVAKLVAIHRTRSASSGVSSVSGQW
jgi:hypothetical protein